jgi:hypothetical protein
MASSSDALTLDHFGGTIEAWEASTPSTPRQYYSVHAGQRMGDSGQMRFMRLYETAQPGSKASVR